MIFLQNITYHIWRACINSVGQLGLVRPPDLFAGISILSWASSRSPLMMGRSVVEVYVFA